MKQILLTLLCGILTLASLHAQEPTPASPSNADTQNPSGLSYTDPSRMTADDYINLKLPPLHVLLENARERSPQVNMFAASKRVEERELKTIRRNWMKHIKLNSSMSYGSTDTNSEQYYDNKYPVVQNVSGSTQRWWNVGASISLPLEEIFNRRNRNKQQKERIESISFEQDKWYDEICLQIIESYSAALQNMAIVESAAKALVTAKAQYAAAETDFVNGQIDFTGLSRQKNIENAAVREYEQTRAMVTKALLELEVLSRTPIINATPIGQ